MHNSLDCRTLRDALQATNIFSPYFAFMYDVYDGYDFGVSHEKEVGTS